MSDAMTPERLEEIRSWAGLADAQYGGDPEVNALLAHVDHLTAEVARLRAGIARVMVTCTDRYAADALLDLLNPTEGETDHADA